MRIRLASACTLALASAALAACGSSGPTSTATATAAGSASVRVTVPAGNAAGAFTKPRTLTLLRGWSIEAWALVDNARFMVWTPQGALLVSRPADGDVTELVPRANRSAAPAQRVLLSGLTNPQGLAFDTQGSQTLLYVAESNEIDRYVWRGAAGVGARTVIVRNLPDEDSRGDDVHRAKTLVVGADHRIYVMIGSAFNASPLDVAGNPPRASVVSFAPSGGDMKVLATGARNSEGLSFAPDGTLWGAINERDNVPYPYHGSYGGQANAYGRVIQSYVDNHPPDAIVALSPGRNVGWPYCNADPAHGYANMIWVDDEQNNPGGKALNCATLPPINRGLPAHSAPLGFNFLEGSKLPASLTGGAVVAVHGSWNREPPRPPALLWLPWSATTHTLGAPVTLISGFQAAGGSRFGRPVDAVPGPDGSLYVSDDMAGAVYRLTP